MNQKDKAKNNKNKRPNGPKIIGKTKYFKIGARDSARVRLIKEGMNHLFDQRNAELEEAFLQEATQYTERVLGETRRFHLTEEDDEEIMNEIFGENREEGAGVDLNEEAEIIDGAEEERLEREAEEGSEEAEEESETLDSEEVLALQERIQAEDQEEYERIRAELEEEEAEDNKHN